MFSSKGLAAMTLAALVFLLAVVGFQIFEITSYSSPPSIWP